MTASGTAGHGAELQAFANLGDLGAHTVKSLAAFEWAGNPAPRLHPTPLGMLNAVGLQGPGVAAWVRDELPALRRSGARIIVSIWGRSVETYAAAAAALVGVEGITAIEVNLSCPNLEGRSGIFAHDAALSAAVIAACRAACPGSVIWAKLSPNTDRIVDVASAVQAAGAEAVTIANTLLGMAIDIETGRKTLGAGGGGFSGPAMHPVAIRAVHDVRAALADIPIIGVGGIHNAQTAIEMMMVGANAFQVGTATFADPRAAWNVLVGLERWCVAHHITSLSQIIGKAHHG